MRNTSITIFLRLICACILSVLGVTNAPGQTLSFPEAWTTEWLTPRPLFQQDTIRICIIGDIMMHGKQIENTARSGSEHDFSSFFSLIEEDIKSADLAIGNMEFTLGGKPYTGYPSFSAPDGLEIYLAECGFDVFLAANNHIFDKGAKGAERTLEKYRELQQTHGIMFTGLAGNEEELAQTTPLMTLVNGVKVAFINYTYGTNQGCGKNWPKTNYISDRQRIEDGFRKAEEMQSDFVVALPHWGIEYSLNHSKEQERQARWMIEMGADAIIGSHPHVVQDRGEIDGIPVAYSLGNAVSNMSVTNSQLELMAILRIVRYSNGDLEMIHPTYKYLWCSLPGGYNDSYTVIPVEDYIGKRDLWHGKWDYDKMVNTYNRIRK
ncbi:MAG: CapA family protein [Bacteroidales bacterium]|nr:CapA family protein [Bacteroidales bacterium]